MNSWKQSKLHYEPEFWEFEYRTHRYLSNLPLPDLCRRYIGIAKNLVHLVSSERHVIPSNTFLSSWYWYRKEYQTRLELHLRGQGIPIGLPVPTTLERCDDPPRPRYPNAGDILYRFASEKRITELAQHGALRMWRADFYATLEKDIARQDEEMTKVSFLNGNHATVTTLDGKPISIVGDIKSSHSGPPYYLLCMSCDWDRRLLTEFNVDRCAVISDVDEFARRLERAASELMPGCMFHHNPVEYFDPYELPPRSFVRHYNSKDFRFAYQREYRFLLVHAEAGPGVQEFLDVKMGQMTDCLNVWPD
ncbi:hypothetical protein [Burkholderia sp. SCN-KJ]|uniref:hypothetical protein n=1 Tax=Burkholderia sp. SCN-KJ TaxID=2969248 RepID=UPI0021501EE8|nr:hypothetical protein [Burkholderia sp. SCN-KJ]MCR4465341.1 hypothetical protein [Burkholderia sp. SCN-KJ]